MTNPAHEDITQRARQIWEDRGRPTGSDDEIWLEAEKQLQSQAASESKGSVKTEKENALADPQSLAAMKAGAQKKEARAPKLPSKSAPKAKPAESGKPIWDKPHSS